MNLVQIAKLNSYNVLQGLLASESVVMGTLPEYDVRSEAFDAAISAIESITPQQVYANRAEMNRYQTYRLELGKACSILSKKLVLYADSTGDTALRNDVKYSKSELLRLKKSKIRDVASMMVERATKVLPNAAVAHLSQADIDGVVDKLTLVMKNKDAQRNRQMKMRNDSRALSEAFAAADVALSKLFMTLDLLADTHPLIYKRLEDARRLIYSYQSLSLRGSVAEAKTEYPIKGVKVAIRKVGDSASPDLMIAPPDVEKVSTELGSFVVKSLPEGNYLLTASKQGYSTTHVQFYVSPSETTRVNVAMEVA